MSVLASGSAVGAAVAEKMATAAKVMRDLSVSILSWMTLFVSGWQY